MTPKLPQIKLWVDPAYEYEDNREDEKFAHWDEFDPYADEDEEETWSEEDDLDNL